MGLIILIVKSNYEIEMGLVKCLADCYFYFCDVGFFIFILGLFGEGGKISFILYVWRRICLR